MIYKIHQYKISMTFWNIVGQVIKEDEKYFYTYNIEYKIDIDDQQIYRNIYYASGETIIQESENLKI